MNNFEFFEAVARLTYEVGQTADGKAILKSKSYRNVKPQQSATAIHAVATAIASLCSYPLVSIWKTETNEIVTI